MAKAIIKSAQIQGEGNKLYLLVQEASMCIERREIVKNSPWRPPYGRLRKGLF
jgi:hypothetical protein